MARFIKTPFAKEGDRAKISINKNADGSVSFVEGWGRDYEKDLATDASAKPVGREEMNGALFDATSAINEWQTQAFPAWISPDDNGGQAYAYARSSVVNFNNKLYVSLINNNIESPAANNESVWQTFLLKRASNQDAIAAIDQNVIITPPALSAGIDYKLKSLLPKLVPVGAILLWGSQADIPDGFLALNGQSFDMTLNPILATLYPNGRVPDYRGMFVRGLDSGRGIDLGREIGVIQAQQVQKHKHVIPWGEMGAPSTTEKDFPFGRTASAGKHGVKTSDRDNFWFHANDGSDFDGEVNAFEAVGDETRPTNIAAVYIIKTDQAAVEEGSEAPTAIVISPEQQVMGAGSSVEFFAKVLPEALAADYPVSWSVGDNDLGSIDAQGVYTANSDKIGVQTIIASISTGLTATVRIEQQIFLSSLSIVDVQEIRVGATYSLVLNKSPSLANETLVFESSNDQIVAVATGTLIAIADGVATITVKGLYSGVSASTQVTVLPEIVVEEYLRIENALSELESDDSKIRARKNLSLGKLSVLDNLSASDVNAFPLIYESIGEDVNLADVGIGVHFQAISSFATPENGYPVRLAGSLTVLKTGAENGRRLIYRVYNSVDEFHAFVYGESNQLSQWVKK